MNIKLVISDTTIEETLTILEGILSIAEPEGRCVNILNERLLYLVNGALNNIRPDQLERLLPLLPEATRRRFRLTESG